jgi:hypothetical protein
VTSYKNPDRRGLAAQQHHRFTRWVGALDDIREGDKRPAYEERIEARNF